MDSNLRYAGDFELWARFWQHADLTTTSCPLGGFRNHPAQKTNHINLYYEEAEQILARYRDKPLYFYLLMRDVERIANKIELAVSLFGSPLLRVDYDFAEDNWVTSSNMVF